MRRKNNTTARKVAAAKMIKRGMTPASAYRIARAKGLSIRQMYKLIIGSKVP